MKNFLMCLTVLFTVFMSHNIYGQTIETTIWVDGACEMCKNRIEQAALEIAGVIDADWNIDSKMLTIEVDTSKYDAILLHEHLAAAGHDTKVKKSTEETYLNLYACCQYRDNRHGKHISGTVYGIDPEGSRTPLTGANVYWLNTTIGTTTDTEGKFSLEYEEGRTQLVSSYVGFGADTFIIDSEGEWEVVLGDPIEIEGVEITGKKNSTEFSFLDPQNTQVISERELTKAACCNLSESFETNASVDVVFTDAITGSRQIQMLGLAGPYVQVTRENIPDIRGLNALYGFVHTPGPWIASIQLSKGVGSVINGFEGITGAINVELKQPDDEEWLSIELYGNQGGRFEGNLELNHKFSNKLSSALLIHGNLRKIKWDKNEDDFLDNPLEEHFIALNRWKFGDSQFRGQAGVKYVYTNQNGGQFDFDFNEPEINPNLWGSGNKIQRAEFWAKTGKIIRHNRSIGLQTSVVFHDQEAYFGSRIYNAYQNSYYANLIYQNIFDNPFHEIKTGISFQYDHFKETVGISDYERNEAVPGAFLEYEFEQLEKISIVTGARIDYHNNYGFFSTPKFHLRYTPWENTVLRASAGRGLRTANVFAENIGIFASNRSIIIEGEDPENPYGLEPEKAWNFGLNFLQNIVIKDIEAILSIDFYHTLFENQVIIDYDVDPQSIYIYNLDGASFSNSVQAQLDLEPVDRWKSRLAYRFNDVKTDQKRGRLVKPLLSRHRAFFNTEYETNNNWRFDLTVNWQGEKRIPQTSSNPEEFRLKEFSEDFFVVNTQISKSWKDELIDLYIGIENIFDYTQDNPVISSDNPFSPYFDASMIWGPIFGRTIYAGLRIDLK